MLRKHGFPVLVIAIVVMLLSFVLLAASQSQAASAKFGCPPETLEVRTGQSFYFTVVISDVTDLYAWQSDLSYNPDYLDYQSAVYGDLLILDGAAQYTQQPERSSGALDHLAATRLGRDTGVDGSGPVLYLVFKAKKDTGTGYTSARATNPYLVDRNALEIDRGTINSGNCRVAIDDDAPVFVQPPIGEVVFLPLLLK
jgi:hypothetical protein